MEYYSPIKKEYNPAICNNRDGPWKHDTKWTLLGRERQILYDLTYMWNLKKKKKKKKKAKLIEIENKMDWMGWKGGKNGETLDKGTNFHL